MVGGDEIVWGEAGAKEGEVAVGRGNLIGREGIRSGSDKRMGEVHGGQAPWEEFPEEDGDEMTGCMKVGRGGHVEVGAEGDSLDVRLGKHARSGDASSEAKKEDHGEANVRILWLKITSKARLTWGECVEGVLIDVEPERGRLWE